MSEALASNVVQATEVLPCDDTSHYAVLACMSDADWENLPYPLPEVTAPRARSLRSIPEDNERSDEEMVMLINTDINALLNPTARWGARAWVAGFTEETMPDLAPDYQKALRALSTDIRRRREEAMAEGTIASVAAARNIQNLSAVLLGSPVLSRHIEAFRAFMVDFGLELYRSARIANKHVPHTITDRMTEVTLHMEGYKNQAIKDRMHQPLDSTHTAKTIGGTMRALQRVYTAEQFTATFADYLAGRELPDIDTIVGVTSRRSVGRVVIATAEVSPAAEPSELPEYTGVELTARFTSAPVRYDWQSDALCAQTDPDAFYPEIGESTRDAKKICMACIAKTACLEYALEHDEQFGVWGGFSVRERRRMDGSSKLPQTFDAYDARAAQLIEQLTVSEKDNELAEAAFVSGGQLRDRFIDAMVTWYNDAATVPIRGTTTRNLQHYFMGQPIAAFCGTDMQRTRLAIDMKDLFRTIDKSDIANPFKYFLSRAQTEQQLAG